MRRPSHPRPVPADPAGPARSLHPARGARRVLAAITTVSLLGGGLATGWVTGAFAADGAAPAGHVVISEAYLSGGSANAPYTTKFVELYNPTSSAVDVSGWSVQYRPATGAGAASGVVRLTGQVPARGHYLVAGGSNGSNGAALPTPDVTSGALNPAGQNGTIALVRSTTAVTLPTGSVTGDAAQAAGVVDLVGYGTSNTFEKAPLTGLPGNSTPGSVRRDAAGTDTDDNSADLTFGTDVTPQGSSSTPDPTPTGTGTPTDPTPTGTGTPTDPTPTDPSTAQPLTIAQVQGTGATSPVTGKTVTTRGVVTATYPTGGYNGLYIQTPGTGGDLELTGPGAHTASDGLFVFSKAAATDLKAGQYVEVTGAVSEFQGLTELTASSWKVVDEAVPAVKPATVAFPATDEQRETLEGMLVAPQGAYTVADNYSTNYYGSFLLAAGKDPFVQPTAAGRPGSPAAAAAVADKAARGVVLDDGATTNFSSAANSATPLPYLTLEKPARVGAPVTFTTPVILDYRYSAWSFQPLTQLTAANAATVQPVTFTNTRTDAPKVAGDLHVATFNVLNYFTTTGDQLSGCTFYTDREGRPVTVKGGCAARGAANAENLGRQQTKIVAAINALGADVVSLEEIENTASVVPGAARDESLAALVDALNAKAGAGTWKYVPSPATVPSGEDVIRTAFIYRAATAQPVGGSTILVGAPAFDNAREPLAQVFRPVGGDASADLLVVANHFKSKGAGDGSEAAGDKDAGDGQGAFNATRVAQAKALLAFVTDRQKAAGTDRALLVGDFNSYAQEDPLQVLLDAGWTDLSEASGKHTYLFDGYVGSLDHAFASPALAKSGARADVWNINSVEPIANEYSRYDYNATLLYDTTPFRSSDHDPIVVGVDTPKAPQPTGVALAALTATPYCAGGKVYVSTSVASADGEHPLDIRLTSPFGDQKFTKVAPLSGVAQVFASGAASVPAGKVTAAGYYWDGVGHYQVYTASYAAKAC